MGLVWLMFGRTRRKEAERFTRSVVTMRTEARSLEALLEVLSQRITDSRSELTMIAQHLMQLGDQATGKLGGITREFDSSSEKLVRHGEALDRAAEAARSDIGVLLDDLPRAEQTARALAEQLRSVGSELAEKAESLGAKSAISPSAARVRTSWSLRQPTGSWRVLPRSTPPAPPPRPASGTHKLPSRERSMRCSIEPQ